MKVVVVGYGSRGDVEPCAAAAVELQRRGHDVAMAVPPNLLGIIESVGLAAVAYGPDSRKEMNPGSALVHNLALRMQNPISVVPEVVKYVTEVKLQKSETLSALAKGVDLVLASFNEQGLAANVAEYYGVPAAALHPFPERVWSSGWLFSSTTKVAEDAQRRALGLAELTGPSTPSLEIQAYDELCLPAPAAQWVEVDPRRPFVGALTLELPTDADDEVLAWIAAGTPPIYFGLGSTPITSPADTFAMISAACAQVNERVLICSGPNDATTVEHSDHATVVDAVNHSAIFPTCRAVVQHGGAGTTAAALRAGIPTLILWLGLDQPLWAVAAQQLEVGFGRCFSDTSVETLVADLRLLLSPQFAAQAREIAVRMTKPAESLANAADLLEDISRLRR